MKPFSPTWLLVTVVLGMSAGPGLAMDSDQPAVVDIALGEHGIMIGRVVDARGVGLVEQPVVLWQGSREIGRAVTGAEGHFFITGVRGGVYQLVAAGQTMVVRAWAAGTEPPAAQQSVLLVSASPAHPSPEGGSPVRRFLTHPLTLTAGVAAAIAIPVALHNSRRSPISPD